MIRPSRLRLIKMDKSVFRLCIQVWFELVYKDVYFMCEYTEIMMCWRYMNIRSKLTAVGVYAIVDWVGTPIPRVRSLSLLPSL